MITENSLGQKINNPERFWKWFGNSITVDEQGRPRVFYHGTRQKFDTFKSEYRDNLIFFSYDEKFAQDWSRNARINDDQKQAYEEIEDKVYAYGKEIYKRFKEKYGEDWLENEDLKDQYYKEKEEYKEQLLKEINLEKKVLGCYLKVSKLFIPERDSDLVLDEIIKYYHWEDKWGLDDKIEVTSENFQKVNNEFEEWWKNNKNAPEEEKKEQNRKLDTAYQAMFSLKNEKAQFDNDLKRIKQGAWIYFEHGNVIDKIYELGYDGIQLSESGGEQTTIAVRPNQIKSVDNKGGYDSSENIYEDFNDNFYKWFGNSKVVDSNGNPLVVYHGTDNEFNEFRLTKHKNDSGFYGSGFYFANTPSEASYYGKIIIPCFLKMNNPFIIEHSTTDLEVKQVEDASILADLGFLKDSDIIKSVELWIKYRYLLDYVECKKDGNEWVAVFTNIDSLNLSKPDYEWLKYERPIGCGYSKENAIYNIWLQIKEHFKIDTRFSLTDYLREHSYEFSDFLKKKGYDGVIANDEYVVFNPNQIKSVDNKGTWSLTSNNIYENLNRILERYL